MQLDTYTVIKETLEELGVPPQEIRPAASLVNDLHLDSLEMAELSMRLEEKFNIDIADDAIPMNATVGDCVEILNRLRGI